MPDDKYLQHFGVLGMRWGVRKSEESSSRRSSSKKSQVKKSPVEENRKVLKKNPSASVINWDAIKKNKDDLSSSQIAARDAKRKKIRNIAIGVGLGIGMAAGAYLYATHKKQVDGAVKGALDKIGGKKVKNLKPLGPDDLDPKRISEYKKFGLKNVKTKQDEVTVNWLAGYINQDHIRSNEMTDEIFNALDDNDISVKAGNPIRRISMKANEILHDGSYVSFDEDDGNRYTAMLPVLRRVNSRAPGMKALNTAHYAMEMEALEELRSPSAKKRVQILADLIKSDSEVASSLGVRFGVPNKKLNSVMLADLEKTFGKGNIPESLKKMYEGPDALGAAKKHYYKVATNLIDHNNVVSRKYLEEVKRRGYNALIDDNDAGRLSRKPLILLNSKAVRVKSSKVITNEMRHEALSKIKSMDSEKWEETYKILLNGKNQNFVDKALEGDTLLAIKIFYNELYK